MNVFLDAMQARAQRLRAELTATQSVAHHLTKGELREAAVREALRTRVPRQFEVAGGLVVDSDGNTSRQQDVLIIDASIAGGLTGHGEQGVFPVEAVVAAIEVKSQLGRDEVTDAFDSVRSVRGLVPEELVRRRREEHRRLRNPFDDLFLFPFGGVIAFNVSGRIESVMTEWAEGNLEHPLRERLDMLLCLDPPTLGGWALDSDDPVGARPADQPVLFSCASEHARPGWFTDSTDGPADMPFVFFLWGLSDVLQRYDPPRYEPFNYLPRDAKFETRFWE